MLPKSGHEKDPMKRSMNMHVPIAMVLQFSMFSYNYIKETFLLFSFEGIKPKRLLISFGVKGSLILILSPPNLKPEMTEKS